ncbi:hypothetical protein ACIBCM_09715 [Streptomyces sp. NPDC051018]|uniref:hypothetical protein n=1 Tax=Streptomyces sp. NPDC051018 TaxID=3365639 RepID=UPI0037A17159
MTASRAALTRDSLRLKITVQRVRLGDEVYRVISPSKPIRHGAFFQSHTSYNLYADRADGRRIGALWLLAARSPRSLVYLPLRAPARKYGGEWDEETPFDLVLAHREVQFRPSRWKRLRTIMRTGTVPRELRTASVPESDLLPDPGEIDYAAPSRREPRELLHQHVHAETLFLTGGTTAFREAAPHLFAVTKDGPPAAATQLYYSGGCNYHVCRSLYRWADLETHGWEQLHMEFRPAWFGWSSEAG